MSIIRTYVPELKIVPRRDDNTKHRYFGPYTSFRELYHVLDGIEEQYDLKGSAFLVRHGSLSKNRSIWLNSMLLWPRCFRTSPRKRHKLIYCNDRNVRRSWASVRL